MPVLLHRLLLKEEVLGMTETQQREEIDSMDDNSTFDKRATARLLRKVDLRLIPFLALLYL
jgi:hypothetical protein